MPTSQPNGERAEAVRLGLAEGAWRRYSDWLQGDMLLSATLALPRSQSDPKT